MFKNIIDFIADNAALIGLIFFFSAFCLVVIMLFLPKQKKKYQDYANIPFKEDEQKK